MDTPVRRRGRPSRTEASSSDGNGERGGIQSLERAAALLEAVAGRPEGIGLAELSQQVGLHTSTAFHLIKTMVSLGFITQSNETRRYRVGSRLFSLAAGALEESTLLALATPILERLTAATNEAAHLAVRSNHNIVVVARTAATGLLTLSDRTGSVRPPHATAIGKMLMASMPEEERRRMVESLVLTGFTSNTITESDKLLVELDRASHEGIAHDRGELDTDVRCIAVPVRDFAGRVVAAMGISGPVWRLSDKILLEKQKALLAAANELSLLLGADKAGSGLLPAAR